MPAKERTRAECLRSTCRSQGLEPTKWRAFDAPRCMICALNRARNGARYFRPSASLNLSIEIGFADLLNPVSLQVEHG